MQNKKGAAMIEYALIIGFIVIPVIYSIGDVEAGLDALFNKAEIAITNNALQPQ